MATSFTRQAQRQLSPAFRQQSRAIRSQIPAINKSFQALSQGLDAQFAGTAQANIEDANARGILNSTIPVDNFAGLSEALIAQKGQLGLQRGEQIAGVKQQLADINVQKASAIQQLVQALQERAFRAQQLRQQRQLADRQFSFDQDLVNRGLF